VKRVDSPADQPPVAVRRAVAQGKRSHIAEERYRNTSRVGGIAGTAQPVPLVGTAIRACLKTCGRDARCSRASRRALGRPGPALGTVSKLAVGVIIVVVLALAAFV
jgi:hypothetical protein